jgi:hypothetical protein
VVERVRGPVVVVVVVVYWWMDKNERGEEGKGMASW